MKPDDSGLIQKPGHLFHPFPQLETGRLILRNTSPSDAEQLFDMRSDPEVMKYVPRPLATSFNDVRNLLEVIDEFIAKGEKINWVIQEKNNDRAIGLIGFVKIFPEHYRAEVGYSLTRSFHRKGIMMEALNAVVNYGFNALDFHSICAIVDAENTASSSLLKKAGFRQEAFFKEDFYYNGSFRNSLHFGVLKDEWKLSG